MEIFFDSLRDCVFWLLFFDSERNLIKFAPWAQLEDMPWIFSKTYIFFLIHFSTFRYSNNIV